MRCPSLKDLPSPPPGKSGWPWTEDTPSAHDLSRYPRVSIVTPSYNQAEFIEETIRSVLLQGYPDLEYILMDGGSTDGSVDIFRKYEPWLAHWVSEHDSGQTQAINRGWAAATGEILAYLNSDDYYLPGAVTVAADTFSTDPGASMVYGTARIIDEGGQELRVWKAQPFDLNSMMSVGSIVPQPATFFTKDALKSVGYLDERWHMIMDYELCIRLSLKFKTTCLDKALAVFRDHPQSKSQAHFERTAKELLDWLETFSPDHVPPKQLRELKQRMSGRVHYELAASYLANGRHYAARSLNELIASVLRFPPFALRRPANTAYLIKEILKAYLVRTDPDRRLGLGARPDLRQ